MEDSMMDSCSDSSPRFLTEIGYSTLVDPTRIFVSRYCPNVTGPIPTLTPSFMVTVNRDHVEVAEHARPKRGGEPITAWTSAKRVDPMSTPENENKELVRQVFEEVWHEGNLDVIDEYFDDDYVAHTNQAPEPIHGPDEWKKTVSMFQTAFPDLEVTIEDIIAEGDKVVHRDRVNGTHEGELMGIPATDAEVENQTIVIDRFEDGKIVETRTRDDALGLMQQLGFVVVPGPRLISRMVIGKVKSLLSGR